MPTIYDNIENHLLADLRQELAAGTSADVCVGYFNLRGWRHLSDAVDAWPGGDGHRCRLLVGMHRTPDDLVHELYPLGQDGPDSLDNARATLLRAQVADEFRRQLTVGSPTNSDEDTLRRLSDQLRAGKVQVKLALRDRLHAKLYLVHRTDPKVTRVGYLGSSNLTFSGLQHQGELNIDVLEPDASLKLQRWFDDRWADRWCLDISDALADIIDTQSWAQPEPVSPYLVYLKMAYHLSQEARAGLDEFRIPRIFGDTLFDFQRAAVQIAARHLNQRGGVLIGDVVGLGKTIMATALAKVMELDQGTETLVICPVNLKAMWERYLFDYEVRGKVLPLSQVDRELRRPEEGGLGRFRVVLIDESHNLRNAEGARYKIIRDYIERNDAKCILLSATPYNKSYGDLAAQLGLFLAPEEPLGIRPEALLREMGEVEFFARHQAQPGTLKGFEKSPYADDWRDLMRRYLVRRTRSFIEANYAERDEDGAAYLRLADGTRNYFPKRVPKNALFPVDPADPADQYGRLLSNDVLAAIDDLRLPRYGLGLYLVPSAVNAAKKDELALADNLGRAGERLKGFCRTNLYKRLESSGHAFLQSIERHILRNEVFLHALDNGLDLPIGSQDAATLDTRLTDEDDPTRLPDAEIDGSPSSSPLPGGEGPGVRVSGPGLRENAARVYAAYPKGRSKRFHWLPASLFDTGRLRQDLQADVDRLTAVIQAAGDWRPDRDAKLAALVELLTETHPTEKVLVFSQFADTVAYLAEHLVNPELGALTPATLAAATGAKADDAPELAARFSPVSNDSAALAKHKGELRVLLATDVLSEGQNLQDCAVVVNFDLPWAIIRLIQRVGRVDRIGQKADRITCYSFLPAEGVEQIIRLRSRVRTRLQENADVVGADERFFEDDDERALVDLYHERAGSLDDETDDDVDLASVALQVWRNAIDGNAKLQRQVETLPDVVFAAKPFQPMTGQPAGALVYARTPDGNDALAWVNDKGDVVTESTTAIFRAAESTASTPTLPRADHHHTLVETAVAHIVRETRAIGGQLGPKRGARYRVYERLEAYARSLSGQLRLDGPDPVQLNRAVEDLLRYPLRSGATETINRLLRAGATDEQLARRTIELREDTHLSIRDDDPTDRHPPKIVCSLGLIPPSGPS